MLQAADFILTGWHSQPTYTVPRGLQPGKNFNPSDAHDSLPPYRTTPDGVASRLHTNRDAGATTPEARRQPTSY